MRLTNRLTVFAERNPDYIRIGYERTWAYDGHPDSVNPITKLE